MQDTPEPRNPRVIRKYIRVVWTCDMAGQCTNKDEPGKHEERPECLACIGVDEDKPRKRK